MYYAGEDVMKKITPIAASVGGAVLGSMFLGPGLGTSLGATAGGAVGGAVGGAGGSAIGSLITGQKPSGTGVLMGAAGGAVGGGLYGHGGFGSSTLAGKMAGKEESIFGGMNKLKDVGVGLGGKTNVTNYAQMAESLKGIKDPTTRSLAMMDMMNKGNTTKQMVASGVMGAAPVAIGSLLKEDEVPALGRREGQRPRRSMFEYANKYLPSNRGGY